MGFRLPWQRKQQGQGDPPAAGRVTLRAITEAKVDEETQDEIRARYQQGEPVSTLAQVFEVSEATIYRILRRGAPPALPARRALDLEAVQQVLAYLKSEGREVIDAGLHARELAEIEDLKAELKRAQSEAEARERELAKLEMKLLKAEMASPGGAKAQELKTTLEAIGPIISPLLAGLGAQVAAANPQLAAALAAARQTQQQQAEGGPVPSEGQEQAPSSAQQPAPGAPEPPSPVAEQQPPRQPADDLLTRLFRQAVEGKDASERAGWIAQQAWLKEWADQACAIPDPYVAKAVLDHLAAQGPVAAGVAAWVAGQGEQWIVETIQALRNLRGEA